VLLDPEAARQDVAQWASTSTSGPARLRAAETLFFARDVAGARAILDGIGDDVDPARKKRLALDLAVLVSDIPVAQRAVLALSKHDGWDNHARRQAFALTAIPRDAVIATFGRVLLALALGILLLGGAKELLVPRKPTLILAGAAAIAALLAAWVSPVLAQLVILVDLAALVLAHAGLATIHRVGPSPKGRVFLAVLVLLGSAGAVLAVLAPIPWSFVLEQTSR